MSNPGQDVQAVYQQYQNSLRQLQFYEQQEIAITGQIEQYRLNLTTLQGLKKEEEGGEFILPLSDILYIKAEFTEKHTVLVDVGSDVYLPTSYEDAEERINKKLVQIGQYLERISSEKSQLQAISSQLQTQINQLGKA